MFKFLTTVMIMLSIASCGLTSQTHQSESRILVTNAQQGLSCTITWDQSWVEMQGASLDDMKQTKIEYHKDFVFDPNQAFKKIEFTPTTMDSGDLDISYSPNINNFKVQIQRINDEEQYRQLDIDPKKEVILSIDMIVVVRDNQRNSHLNSTHFYEKEDDKIRWMQQYAFGPERKETGLAQSGIDDYEGPAVFDAKAPSIQVRLTCKEQKAEAQ